MIPCLIGSFSHASGDLGCGGGHMWPWKKEPLSLSLSKYAKINGCVCVCVEGGGGWMLGDRLKRFICGHLGGNEERRRRRRRRIDLRFATGERHRRSNFMGIKKERKKERKKDGERERETGKMLHIFSRPRSSLFLLLFLDFFLNFLISFFLSISGAHASEIINLLRVYIRLIRNIYSSSRRRGIPESPPAPGGLITSTRQNWRKEKRKKNASWWLNRPPGALECSVRGWELNSIDWGISLKFPHNRFIEFGIFLDGGGTVAPSIGFFIIFWPFSSGW